MIWEANAYIGWEFSEAVMRTLGKLPASEIDGITQQIKDMLVKLGLENDGNEYREVYDDFPEEYTITFWELDQQRNLQGHLLPRRQRIVTINGDRFTLKEWIWDDPLTVSQNWNFFKLPQPLMKSRNKFFIFNSLQNKSKRPVLTLEGASIDNEEVLDELIRRKLLIIRASTYGHSHRSISDSIRHHHHWSFLFWYLLQYNKSLENNS